MYERYSSYFQFLYGNFHGLLDGVHETIQARGISGVAESPGSPPDALSGRDPFAEHLLFLA